jgi:hypothetical protein
MTWFDPQVKQFPLTSSNSSDWHWLTHIDPFSTLPEGQPQDLPPMTTMVLGHTEQNPLMRKPLVSS